MRELKNTKKFRGEKMRKFGLSFIIALSVVMLMATAAFAVHTNDLTSNNKPDATGSYHSAELGVAGNQDNVPGGKYAIPSVASGASINCVYCHEQETKHTSGPHGGYTTTSNKCLTCHGLHARSTSNKAWSNRLLPGQTTVQVCNFCHDLTQSDLGPYFGHYMSGKNYDNTAKPKVVKSAHRITGVTVYDANNADVPAGYEKYDGTFNKADLIVPGGDYATGGDRDLVVSGQGALSGAAFTCDSCHTPHAITGGTVDPYLGESHIKWSATTSATTFWNAAKTVSKSVTGASRFWMTDRLLKARIEDPNKIRTTTDRVYTKYNSNWCASCHMGRFANDVATGEATVHNHPVSVGDANPKADGYKFLQLATYINGYDANSFKTEYTTSVRLSTGYWVKPTFYATNVADAVFVKNSTKAWDGSDIYWGTPFGTDIRTNKQYTMTSGDPLNNNAARPDGYINIADAAGGPSCQQCHGSARDVEQSFATFATAVKDENLAMNFPHVSENKALLVEQDDDFCTNCHGLDNLP